MISHNENVKQVFLHEKTHKKNVILIFYSYYSDMYSSLKTEVHPKPDIF